MIDSQGEIVEADGSVMRSEASRSLA